MIRLYFYITITGSLAALLHVQVNVFQFMSVTNSHVGHAFQAFKRSDICISVLSI